MKELREGFTTGSCAAAAALACCLWQRDGVCPDRVKITVPAGKDYIPEIIPHPEDGSCGVYKDSGDDPDITNGMEIRARVIPGDDEGAITFRAGEGVGIVTQPGLKIPVGEPAINPVPREMIEDAVRSVYGSRSAVVEVSIPGGREIAARTFNPRLGITCGLSVLGTTGVVRPMSLQALRESLYVELRMRVFQKKDPILFTFGNQGEKAMAEVCPGVCVVQVSNEIGFMLDSARELGVKRLIIGGHPGKLAKVSAGVMQTHSRTADARREAIITHLALMGVRGEVLQEIYSGVTTDTAIRVIDENGLGEVWDRLAYAAWEACRFRTGGEIDIEVIFVEHNGRVLGRSRGEQA